MRRDDSGCGVRCTPRNVGSDKLSRAFTVCKRQWSGKQPLRWGSDNPSERHIARSNSVGIVGSDAYDRRLGIASH